MDRRVFLELMDELLELPPGTLNGDERLSELKTWDSLALIGFMAIVTEHTGVVLMPKAVAACATVHDLMALLVQKEA